MARTRSRNCVVLPWQDPICHDHWGIRWRSQICIQGQAPTSESTTFAHTPNFRRSWSHRSRRKCERDLTRTLDEILHFHCFAIRLFIEFVHKTFKLSLLRLLQKINVVSFILSIDYTLTLTLSAFAQQYPSFPFSLTLRQSLRHSARLVSGKPLEWAFFYKIIHVIFTHTYSHTYKNIVSTRQTNQN